MLCTRKFRFDAAHRVLQHESKCRRLHGHAYSAEIQFYSPELDSLGRVIDFGFLKELIGGWIDSQLDHNVILNSADPLCEIIKTLNLAEQRPFILIDKNPTAENLASMLLSTSNNILIGRGISDITACHVRLHETPNCYADAYVVGYYQLLAPERFK